MREFQVSSTSEMFDLIEKHGTQAGDVYQFPGMEVTLGALIPRDLDTYLTLHIHVDNDAQVQV